MYRLFALDEGCAKPVDPRKLTDETNDYDDTGLYSGIRGAINDSQRIPVDQLVLAGSPVGITATSIGANGRIDFDNNEIVKNAEGLGRGYGEDVIFLIGNHSIDPSYNCWRVIPAVPYRLNGRRNQSGEYGKVSGRLFRYDNFLGKVVSVSPEQGEYTPVCELEISETTELGTGGRQIKRTEITTHKSGVPLVSKEEYLRAMLPESGVVLDPNNLFLLESPGIYWSYGQDRSYDEKGLPGVTQSNRASNFLAFSVRGLKKDLEKTSNEAFPPDKIVRVISDIRGDSCCTLFTYAMFGYQQ